MANGFLYFVLIFLKIFKKLFYLSTFTVSKLEQIPISFYKKELKALAKAIN